jgi:hypothetical protein
VSEIDYHCGVCGGSLDTKPGGGYVHMDDADNDHTPIAVRPR